MPMDKFFISLLLFYFAFLMDFAFSTSFDLEKIREEQQSKQKEFIKTAHQFQRCSQELRRLETQFHDLQSGISKKRDLCKSPQSGDDYRNCVRSLSQIVKDMKTLQSAVSDSYKECPLFTSEKLIRRLSNFIAELEIDSISIEGRDGFVSMDADVKNNIYESKKLSYCSRFISSLGDNIFSFGNKVNLNAHGIVPDIYLITKSMLGLKVYGDYVSQIKELCLEKTDPEKHDSYQEYVKLIQDKEERLKRWIFNAFQNHAHLDFEKSAQKICKSLNTEVVNDNHKSISEELCANPANNDSWIYSAHYLIKQRRESSETE